MPLKLQHDDQPTLNLTPMIDVVFLLIIFFMVATKFNEMERNIAVKLPQVAAAEESSVAPKKRNVDVFEDGHIELDGQVVALEELTRRLSQTVSQTAGDAPQSQVIIRGDARCQYQHVAAALAACKEAHVAELGITVETITR